MSRKMSLWQKVMLHLLLLLCVSAVVLPIVLVFFASLKESSTLISTSLIPKWDELSLVNYKRLLTETHFLRWLLNTVIVSTFSSVIAIAVKCVGIKWINKVMPAAVIGGAFLVMLVAGRIKTGKW